MAKTGFDKVVAVKFGLEWIPVDSAEHALTCLDEFWPDKSGVTEFDQPRQNFQSAYELRLIFPAAVFLCS